MAQSKNQSLLRENADLRAEIVRMQQGHVKDVSVSCSVLYRWTSINALLVGIQQTRTSGASETASGMHFIGGFWSLFSFDLLLPLCMSFFVTFFRIL